MSAANNFNLNSKNWSGNFTITGIITAGGLISTGSENSFVKTLSISGLSPISGVVSFIPSGNVVLGYSGNNIVVGVPSVSRVITTVTGTPYTVLSTDDIVEINYATGTTSTIILPSGLSNGAAFVLKDNSGTASQATINISGQPNIDGTGYYRLVDDYGSISVYKGTNGWRII